MAKLPLCGPKLCYFLCLPSPQLFFNSSSENIFTELKPYEDCAQKPRCVFVSEFNKLKR